MPPQVNIHIGPGPHIEKFAAVIVSAFENDVMSRLINLQSSDLPNDTVISYEDRLQEALPRYRQRAEANPHFVEAGNWAAVALWFPPGIKIPYPDPKTAAPVMVEYYSKFSEIKKKHLGERQYYYLNLLGRHPERTDKGVIRAIMDTYIGKAREEKVPLWLESTNVHARDVYLHLGFKLVEEVSIQAGKADKDGYRVEGGEGVKLYAMIFENEG